jgi:phosphatidylserine decarboxylase
VKRQRATKLKITYTEGKIYDRIDPAVVQPHIQSFIETYEIDTSQLLQPDVAAYKVHIEYNNEHCCELMNPISQTFNDFFARRLKPDVRPVTAPDEPSIITSLADCRLTVWNNVATATKIWYDLAFLVH